MVPLVRPFAWVLTCAMAAVMAGMTPACGGDGVLGVGESLVGGLAVLSDLESTAASEAAVLLPLSGTPATKQAMARQSVPARDRAVSYRNATVFALSKAAVPLLVVDLEPREASVARPMSGRSVGARPSAAWTRTMPTFSESVAQPRTSSSPR